MKSSTTSVTKRIANSAIAFVCASGIGLTVNVMPAAWAANTADFVFLIDESGSMISEHQWLGNMIYDLDLGLLNEGLTNNRYGLIGFGSGLRPGILGRGIDVGGGQFGTASEFDAATSMLLISGGFEDGYSAMNYALTNYSFREEAAINFVLVTDEDRDNGNASLTFESIEDALNENDVLLNAVVNYPFINALGNRAIGADGQGDIFIADGSGGFTEITGDPSYYSLNITSKTDYIDLAWATGNNNVGGAAWDLNMLRAGGNSAKSFTAAFVDTKIQEVTQIVPEPSFVFGLLVIGTLGTSAILKYKQQDKR